VFIARAMCGLTHVTAAALCFSCSLLCISKCDWAPENEAGRSVSVNGNEESRWRDLSPTQFSCNCNYSLITHNKTPVHSTWRLLRVRPARLSVLTGVPSSVPPGTISKIRSPPGSRRIQPFAGNFRGQIWGTGQKDAQKDWVKQRRTSVKLDKPHVKICTRKFPITKQSYQPFCCKYWYHCINRYVNLWGRI